MKTDKTGRRAWLRAVGLGAVLLVGPAVLAEGPEIKIDQGTLESAVTDEHIKQADAYVRYWVEALRTAEDSDRVIFCRKRISEGYDRTRAPTYQAGYAQKLAEQGQAMLAQGVPGQQGLAELKEASLAMVVGRMAQPAIQPLVDAMVQHRNAAVRFLGWGTYAQLRPVLMAQGGAGVQRMYAAVAKSAATETDPHVLGAIWSAVRLVEKPAGMDDAEYRDALKKALGALKADWIRRCQEVVRAEAASADAAREGVVTVSVLMDRLGEDPEAKAATQMVLNAAYAAGKALDAAEQTVKKATTAREEAELGAAGPPPGPELTGLAAPPGPPPPGPPPGPPPPGPSPAPGPKPPPGGTRPPPRTPPATRAAPRPTPLRSTPPPKAPPKPVRTADDVLLEAEQAISDVIALLKDCERTLNQLTKKSHRYVEQALAGQGDRAVQVQLAVLKWSDELVKEQGLTPPTKAVAAASSPAP